MGAWSEFPWGSLSSEGARFPPEYVAQQRVRFPYALPAVFRWIHEVKRLLLGRPPMVFCGALPGSIFFHFLCKKTLECVSER
jgi:hypothetical protein